MNANCKQINANTQDKFKNKYRIKSTRLNGWDYSCDGMYFVTLCTKDRKLYFGNIETGKMKLSMVGTIAHQCWLEIPKHYPNVSLDEFMVMPNHIHGIIVIHNVETQNFASLHCKDYKNKFGPQSKNLSSMIRGFKIGVKKWATLNNNHFQWQSRFYDHVIRDEGSLDEIRQYICDNPSQWEHDRNNPNRITHNKNE